MHYCVSGMLSVCSFGGSQENVAVIQICSWLQDTLCTAGMQTTAGARVLKGYVPSYDATSVARLKTAGAVIVGKTNCDAFAMGSTTESSDYQVNTFKTFFPKALCCLYLESNACIPISFAARK